MKRNLLPMLLIALGLSLLIGCFYIPTFERSVSSAQKDFRKLVGQENDRPLRVGYANRTEVLRLLGPPPLISADRSAIGYLFETRQGYWVWPICFSAESANNKVYGLRLDFGSDDVLRKFKVASGQFTHSVSGFPTGMVVQDLNESGGPPLLWHGNGRIPDFDLHDPKLTPN